MILLAIGCNTHNTPVEVRERIAFKADQLTAALDELDVRYGCEAVILSTCNRVELYLGRVDTEVAPDADLIAEFLAEIHGMPSQQLRPYLYERRDGEAVTHLFRVASSLDSMIVGEGQIAGQVKRAYELAQGRGSAGPLLNALFQRAHEVAKRVRSQTGIARGRVSVSSVAVDYVRQVFDHFDDKTILVIGAGKMGELTLKHLRELKPGRIWVTNRSPEKAQAVAAGCHGQPIPWEQLDDALAQADIVLSTTDAPHQIVTLERYQKIVPRRTSGTVVILDIAVPRDFDPRIHDGDQTCLIDIDDLKGICRQTLADRLKHVAPAEAIVAQEVKKFLQGWARRRHGPIIQRLTQDFDAKREAVIQELLGRLNGKLDDKDRALIEGAFRLLQNRFLHGPISALSEDVHETGRHTLLEALRKLFRLQE